MNKKKTITFIATVAIFSALSVILHLLKFAVPFLFPGFLKIQFSLLPAIICGFALGPWGGIAVLTVRTLITLATSSSALVGHLADFIIGLGVVLTTSLIFHFNKTKKGAIIALVFGSVAWVVVSILANYFVLVPLYIELYYKSNLQTFVAACSIIPGINENNYMLFYILGAVIPFNLVISIIVNLVTFLVYRKVSDVIERIEK